MFYLIPGAIGFALGISAAAVLAQEGDWASCAALLGCSVAVWRLCNGVVRGICSLL